MKKLKKITVFTGKNGYSLQYEGMKRPMGYLYYTAEELVAGIMKHIVMDDDKDQNMDICTGLLQSMASWPETHQLHTANAKLIAEAKEATRDAHNLRLKIYDVHHLNEDLKTELRNVKTQLALANVKIDKYNRLRSEIDKEERRKEKRSQSEVFLLKTYEKERQQAKEKSKGKTTLTDDEDQAHKPAKTPTKPKTTTTTHKKINAKKLSPEAVDALLTPLSIDKTNLSVKTIRHLKLAGGYINHHVCDIIHFTRRELLQMRGIGNVMLDEWESWLKKHGLSMGMVIDKEILLGMRNDKQ